MNKPNLEELMLDMERVAEENGCDPSDMSRAVYLKAGSFTNPDFIPFGGYNAVRADLFGRQVAPLESNPTNLAILRGTQARRSEVSRLQREIGTATMQYERFRAALQEAFTDMPVRVSKPHRGLAIGKKRQFNERVNMLMISDTHFGLNIDPHEVESNQYNWTIAARRLAKVAHDAAHFKFDHRNECQKLVINFGGDLCQGIIHADDAGQELMTYQMVGAARMVIEMLDYLRNYYHEIECAITDDNHMRLITLTKGKDRATSQKFDSYNSMMFEIVQQAFRHDPDIKFFRPKTPYTEYKVFGRTHFLTHGDTVLKLGWVSKKIDTKELSNQVANMNSTRSDENRIEVVWAGHVHTGLQLALECDVDVFINPSMSGIDPYAQSLGILGGSSHRPNRTGQWLMESTREERVGDSRIVWASKADREEDFEKIIKPFDYELALKKSF